MITRNKKAGRIQKNPFILVFWDNLLFFNIASPYIASPCLVLPNKGFPKEALMLIDTVVIQLLLSLNFS